MKVPVTSNLKDGKQDQHVIPEEGLNYTQRMEKKMDQLRMRWAGSDYEILLEKLEMLESWQEERDEDGVKESLLDWMLTNKEVTQVEEGEDILDGVEIMMESGGS